MNNLVAIPVVLPLLTAVVLTLFHGRPRTERRVSAYGGVLLLAVAGWLMVATWRGGILVLPVGNWEPTVGIVWVVDRLSALMLLLTGITSLATLCYAPASLRGDGERRYFYLLHQFLLVGINGSFVTGDFFNLFVFFEVMLLSSFVLLALGARARQLNHAFPYVLINLIGSALFLGGIGAVYGTAGTVNMAELSRRVAVGGLPAAFWAALALVLVVFAIKTALLPLFFWLPDAYPEAPIPVRAFFGGLLTKVGVYTLLRAVPLITGGAVTELHGLLVLLAAATMLMGVLGALGRSSIREVLSFLIISSVGYVVFGLALGTPAGLAGAIFYTMHSVVVTTALFFAGGIAERVGGSDRLGQATGLARTHPWVAAGFFVAALALAGLPPFSGFWGKFFLIVSGFRAGAYAATTIAVVAGLVALAAVLRIWTTTFWGEPAGQEHPRFGHDRGMVLATLALAAVSVAIGLGAGPLWSHSERTAEQLLAVSPYVDAVLGTGAPDTPTRWVLTGGGTQ
jgi:multicomponent Na+:H+ antiporter subunit D